MSALQRAKLNIHKLVRYKVTLSFTYACGFEIIVGIDLAMRLSTKPI